MPTVSSPPLRLLVVGGGLIGRKHIELIAASPACRLCGVVDPAPGAAALAAASGAGWHAELGAALDAQRPDGVILATPNALHVPQALQCLDAGVPVLVEKPVADTVHAAQTLVAAVAASGVPLLVGHHRRHSAVMQAAARVIEDGTLGRLVAVTASATFCKPDGYFSDAPWRARPGGGPILINLVHEIDSLRMLVGDIVQVQAMASSDVRGHAVEDTVAIGLRFANGALGTFMLSDAAASPRSWEQTSGENAAYDHHAGEDCYHVAGTRGSLAVPTLRLRCYEGAASWTEPLVLRPVATSTHDPLSRQLAHFCAVVRGQAAPRVSAADAARTLAVTLAVAEAARTHAVVACAPLAPGVFP